MRRTLTSALATVVAVLALAPAQASTRSPVVTLAAPTETLVNTAFVLRGRLLRTGAANNKVVVLQERVSGAWVRVARLRRQDDGPYRFWRQASRPDTYVFRTMVFRRGVRLDVSPRRAVRLVRPAPDPPSTPPAPTSAPPAIAPPSPQTGTNPTEITAIQPGALLCPLAGGEVGVTAPYLANGNNPFGGYIDWYIDYLWRWNGSTWDGIGWGPWSWKQRGMGGWTREDTGIATNELTFAADSDRWYAATQFVYDGQMGGYWQQVYARFGGGEQPYCLVW